MDLLKDSFGKPQGHALAEVKSLADADKAIEVLRESMVEGFRLLASLDCKNVDRAASALDFHERRIADERGVAQAFLKAPPNTDANADAPEEASQPAANVSPLLALPNKTLHDQDEIRQHAMLLKAEWQAAHDAKKAAANRRV